MEGELTAWMTLATGARVRVRMCVFEDPRIPTPGEAEIARMPAVPEWPEITANIARMNFDRIES